MLEPSPLSERPPNEPRQSRAPWLAAAALIGAVYIAFEASSATLPLLVACLIAYFLAPLIGRLERRGWPRGLVVGGIALVFLGAIASGGYFFGSRAVATFREVAGELGTTLAKVSGELEARWGIALPDEPGAWLGMIERRNGGSQADLFASTTRAVGGIVGLLTIPLLGFLVLYDFDRIVAFIHCQIPKRHRGVVRSVARELDHALRRLLRGIVLVASILVVLYSLGFSVVGTPKPVLVGVVAGIGNMVPFVGTAIGIVLAMALVLLHHSGLTVALLTLGVFGAVQLLESWIITPRVVGGQVGVPPLAVLIAVLIFGDLFGVVGLFLAVPVAITIRVIGGAVLERYHCSPTYRGETST